MAAACPHCSSHQTHVSYEDPTANYCRDCGRYWRDRYTTTRGN
jgi:uncharacterized Zn ribbon protein